jgi:prolipoprotein diacylglyceryltransferase
VHASDIPLVLGLVMIVGALACVPTVVKRARTRPAPSRKQRLTIVGLAVLAMVVGAAVLQLSR